MAHNDDPSRSLASPIVVKSRRYLVTVLSIAAMYGTPAAAQLAPAALRGYFTATTDYVDRGLSQSDSRGSLQVGIDYQHASGFFVGAWASTLDYPAGVAAARSGNRGIDYYAGFGRRRGDWSWTTVATRYTYPGAAYDYDYNELAASVSYRRRYSYSVAVTDDLLSYDHRAIDHEANLSWPLPWNVEFSAGAGKFRVEGIPASSYSYWNAGASKIFRRFVVDLRYYDGGSTGLIFLGEPARRQWVLSMSYGVDLIAPKGIDSLPESLRRRTPSACRRRQR